jgi:hypothetical protein
MEGDFWMSRHLVMALIASGSLASAATASTQLTYNVDLYPVGAAAALELKGTIIATPPPMKCDKTSFTISVPKAAPGANGEPKWYNLIRLTGGMAEFHVLNSDETSFTRSGLKINSRTRIILHKARKMSDGNYQYIYGGNGGSTYFDYNNTTGSEKCIST